jgi:hypothetical protein
MKYPAKLLSVILIFMVIGAAFATDSLDQTIGEAVEKAVKLAIDRAIEEEMEQETKPKLDTNDIFWNRLKDKNVTILEEPEFTNGTGCGQEWSVHGNLCEIKSLTAFAKRESTKLCKAGDRMAKTMSRFERVITGGFEITSKFRDANLKTTGHKAKYFQMFTSLDTSDLKTLLERIKAGRKDRSLNKCWRKMAGLRSSGLCAICSGRHSSFIEAEKVLISKETCDEFLTQCAGPFRLITDFVILAHKISEAIIDILDANKYPQLNMASKDIDQLAKRIKRTGISRLIAKYLNDKNPVLSAELCSTTISVSKRPFALQLAKLLSKFDFEKFNLFNLNLKKTLQSRTAKNSASNWSGSAKIAKPSRVLKLLSESNPSLDKATSFQHQAESSFFSEVQIFNSSEIFEGDVKVQSTVDSSYNAFLGANGTSGNEASGPMKHLPLNLTNRFP